MVNGFCRKPAPGESTPWVATASVLYPDMNTTRIPVRTLRQRCAELAPVHAGHDHVGEQQVDCALVAFGDSERGGSVLRLEHPIPMRGEDRRTGDRTPGSSSATRTVGGPRQASPGMGLPGREHVRRVVLNQEDGRRRGGRIGVGGQETPEQRQLRPADRSLGVGAEAMHPGGAGILALPGVESSGVRVT